MSMAAERGQSQTGTPSPSLVIFGAMALGGKANGYGSRCLPNAAWKLSAPH